jgi:cytochrome c-type biogenesis protein CcmH
MIRAILLAVILSATAAFAVQPGEVLDDPVLEQRARELSKGLRCLVCRNESIDESNAELARDLRILVRERLVAGDTDEAVIDFLVARYGEYVLLSPRASGSTLILWAAGPLMLILALLVAVQYLRSRRSNIPDDSLSQEETARLRELMDK